MEMVSLREQWKRLLHAWQVDPVRSDRLYEAVAAAYSTSDRYYHTLDHVAAVLDTVEQLAARCHESNAVRLAAWLHDVIYDSKASDNEERSAVYARKLCEESGIPGGDRVASLILKTKTHDAGNDPDAQVLLDADLAILGAAEPDYRDYAEKIRREYAWVPDIDYRQGRRRVLERFLARPAIYHFLGELESQARVNLGQELQRLDR